jgi:hypothetical protein
MDKVTREQLLDVYEKHGVEPIIEAFLALQDTVEKLERRVENLEQQIAKNSHNSSKPLRRVCEGKQINPGEVNPDMMGVACGKSKTLIISRNIL